MPETMSISTPDGAFEAYVATPEANSGPWPGVVVIQEIFGVNDVVRTAANRLAGAGFLAVAPDLFWRQEPGVQLTDKTEEEWARGFALMKGFDFDKGMEDIQTTVTAVRNDPRCTGKVATVGYCLGGQLAYLASTRTDVDASVGYYGVGLEGLMGEKHAIARPLLLHIAGADHFVGPDQQRAIHEGLDDHPKVTLHDYQGLDHGFATEIGARRNEEGAELADSRTAAFFAENLGLVPGQVVE